MIHAVPSEGWQGGLQRLRSYAEGQARFWERQRGLDCPEAGVCRDFASYVRNVIDGDDLNRDTEYEK